MMFGVLDLRDLAVDDDDLGLLAFLCANVTLLLAFLAAGNGALLVLSLRIVFFLLDDRRDGLRRSQKIFGAHRTVLVLLAVLLRHLCNGLGDLRALIDGLRLWLECRRRHWFQVLTV